MGENVFTKAVLVQIKTREKEERSTRLNITIEIRTTAAPLQKKFMYIQLTDPNDSFFLFTLRIDEDDFQSLKSNQGLLVDYTSFPQKLTELFTLCVNEEKREIPKFILQLLVNDGFSTLNIVETNPFKHLTHLSLKVLPGNDTAIKNFLSDCLKDYKEKCQRLSNHLENTESSLRSSLKATEEALVARNAEFTSMKLQWDSKLSEIQAKHAQTINQEKEDALKAQHSLQQRYQLEKKDLEQAHMKIVKQLEARVYELDTQNQKLTEMKYVNAASIGDFTSKLSVAEEENQRMSQDVKQLRKDNTKLDSELHRQEKIVSELHTRIAVLEQQLIDKDTTINNSDKLLQSEQSQKKLIEDELSNCKTRISQLETSIKTLSDEVLKANEIIRKLQQDNKNVHTKLKLRSQIALKQEEVLKDKENQIEKQEAEMKQIQTAYESKAKATSELENQLEKTKEELLECQKKISSNENVISWLNKQMDQLQLNRVKTNVLLSNTSSPPIHTVSMTNTTSSTRNSLNKHSEELGETPSHGSTIPQPKYKSTPVTDTVEHHDKENEHAIDAKYLPQSSITTTVPTAVPLRTRNWQVNQSNPLIPSVKPRITKEVVNSHHALATAYFPKQK